MPLTSRARSSLKLAAGSLAFLAGIQLVRPELDNPPVVADIVLPPAVKSLFVTACYDCHSNQTNLRWFDRITPANWLVAHDVRTGRAHLNFSDLGALPAAKQRAALFEALNQAELGAMPPTAYRLVHPGSVLNNEQFELIRSYLQTAEPLPPAAPSQVAAADAQYRTWLASGPTHGRVAPAPNGIAFLPDYKDWQVVSTTDRFDDNRLRVVLGNDVTARAIAEHKTNPWPDGSAFAKVAWDKLVEPDGGVRAGEFRQVAFMLKDATKYASTQGWGYARWLGTALEPYGKNADFAKECTGCHEPMRARDFVFTDPVAGTSVPPSWRLITSGVQPGDGTMWVLYGNDLAVMHARHARTEAYPAGAVLSLVVWEQRSDPRWFGARIPGRVRSTDSVTVGAQADLDASRPLAALTARASVMP